MTARQLKTWIEQQLKEAEPLDRPSTMDDPQGVATKAAKKLGLLGCGRGELLAQANRVETPSECAAVLIDCLAALPVTADAPASGGMSVVEAAEVLGVSKETVYRLVNEQVLPHSRVRGRITINQQQLADYQNQ